MLKKLQDGRHFQNGRRQKFENIHTKCNKIPRALELGT